MKPWRRTSEPMVTELPRFKPSPLEHCRSASSLQPAYSPPAYGHPLTAYRFPLARLRLAAYGLPRMAYRFPLARACQL